MTSEQWIIFFILTFFIGCALMALAVLVRVYAPLAVSHLDQVVQEHSGTKQFFIGFLNSIPLLLLVVGLAKVEPLKLVALLLFVGILTLAFLGLVARARAVGRDVLFRFGFQRFTEIHEVLAGFVLLVPCMWIPLIGQMWWIGLGLQGLGTGLLWLFRRYQRVDESDVTEPIRL